MKLTRNRLKQIVKEELFKQIIKEELSAVLRNKRSYRVLNEEADEQGLKVILNKVWKQFNETGLPRVGERLGDFGGESCTDTNQNFITQVATDLEAGKTFAPEASENLHKIVLETNQQLKAYANTSSDSRVKQIASEYNKLFGVGYKAREAVRAMQAEDPKSIRRAITACCRYRHAEQEHREEHNGGDQRGSSAQISRILGT